METECHAEAPSRTPTKAKPDVLGAGVVIVYKENRIHEKISPLYCLVLDLILRDI